MGKAQKTKSSTTVRIWKEPKERLQNLAWTKSMKEKRTVTEAELSSLAVEQYCTKEEKKLGL